jgi:hypothetical protein
MELSRSWETASCAATQEFSNILQNPTVHYRIDHSCSLVPILSHPILSHHLGHLGLPSDPFPYGITTKILQAYLFGLMHAT